MEAIFLGITIFITVYALSSWSKIVTDSARSDLFALRDELREYFIANKKSDDIALYNRTRNLLNSHLKCSEFISFKYIIHLIRSYNRNKNIYLLIHKDVNRAFYTPDQETREFIAGIRAKAANCNYKLAVDKNIFVFLIMQCTNLFLSNKKKQVIKTIENNIEESAYSYSLAVA